MQIAFRLNNVSRTIDASPGENVQVLLKGLGICSVRDSDDHNGYAGSDAIWLDGKIVNAGLLVAGQIDGHEIKTVEHLSWSSYPGVSVVQEAMVDTGVVQSGFNAPAAALMLSDLLERVAKPTREDVVDALSGLFVRDCGYEQFFRAVELARQRMRDPQYQGKVAPLFRKELRDVGTPRPKVDGLKLVTGKPAFVEDMVSKQALVLKMLRSPHAHAYIRSIDTREAESIPGVAMVITHANCPDGYYGQAGQGFPEPSPYDRRMFAPKVRHVGDRVAAVVAEDDEIAERALALIRVEYDVLEPVFSIDAAAAQNAPVVQGGIQEYCSGAPVDLDLRNQKRDPREGKIVYRFPIGADPHRNIAASVSGGIGDIGKGFAQADVVIEREYTTSQVQSTPLEPHVVFTRMDGDRLVIHASTQVPWHLRRIVATILGIGQNRVRVVKERVGGGYGSKQDILLEEVCAFATWTTGRPVFFRYTRREEFIAGSTRHPTRIRIKLGVKKDGRLTAIQMKVEANTGPFGAHCLTVPMNACSKALPLFLCQNVAFEVVSYYSNIFPTGAYQGYGAPQGSFALQTAMGELAQTLGMDHLELIQKNRVQKGSVLEILRCLGEGRSGSAARVSSCGLETALSRGAAMIAWGKREKSDERPHSPHIKIGKGVVIVQQGSGLPGLDQANADIKLLSDGSFILHSGGADIGTGLDTVCAKMASETLCTDIQNIAVISGDTDNTPFDSGAYASSGTFFSGNAALRAAQDLKKQIIEVAAAILGEKPADLQLEYPGQVVGRKGSLSFAKIAHTSQTGEGPGQLTGRGSFTSENSAFPYGAHFCQVAVNTQTGQVKVQKYYALQDCGTPINPELAQGQIYGGVLKAIGHTLWEEVRMDAKGRCLNPDLANYGAPMMGDLPEDFRAELVETEDPFGPFGAKSVSEISTNGAAPAIAMAIHDAVGVWMRSWPFTAEKILRAMGKI
jgi:putative selenate reductase molybdopterin-binding subunit